MENTKPNPLPPELRDRILSVPLWGQKQLLELFPGVSPQAAEQGRFGRGMFAGLKYAKIGRRVMYPATSIIEFIEGLPVYASTTEASEARRTA